MDSLAVLLTTTSPAYAGEEVPPPQQTGAAKRNGQQTGECDFGCVPLKFGFVSHDSPFFVVSPLTHFYTSNMNYTATRRYCRVLVRTVKSDNVEKVGVSAAN